MLFNFLTDKQSVHKPQKNSPVILYIDFAALEKGNAVIILF